MSRKTITFLYLLISFFVFLCSGDKTYMLDDSAGFGRTFDGIGGLSGGGVRATFTQSWKPVSRDLCVLLLLLCH